MMTIWPDLQTGFSGFLTVRSSVLKQEENNNGHTAHEIKEEFVS